jgi:Domain of unknown function (DUF4169)
VKVVSLSAARKARAKDAAKAQADANAARFGRTKAQKAVEDADQARTKAVLDAHKIDP